MHTFFRAISVKILSALTLSALALTAPAASAQTAPVLHGDTALMSRQLLFSGGDGVSKFYRIPALVTTPTGRLVALADRRLTSNKDLAAPIDVVCRYSDDNGQTWSPQVVVAANDSVGGYGDAVLGVAPGGDLVAVMAHGQGFWESDSLDRIRVCLSRSADGGQTWSAPADMTDCIYSPTPGVAPVRAYAAFGTSGRMLTDRNGTMWFVLVARPHKAKYSAAACHACFSTDGGRTWQSQPVAVDTDADESRIVECADGSLLVSIRNRQRGWRKFARSTDGGRTWVPAQVSATLPDPACNGSVIRTADGLLLHTVPADHADRYNVSLFYSRDNGNTWHKSLRLCPVRSAYSDITEMADGNLAVLTEEASSAGGMRIWLNVLDRKKCPGLNP